MYGMKNKLSFSIICNKKKNALNIVYTIFFIVLTNVVCHIWILHVLLVLVMA